MHTCKCELVFPVQGTTQMITRDNSRDACTWVQEHVRMLPTNDRTGFHTSAVHGFLDTAFNACGGMQ